MDASGDRKPRFIWALTLLVASAACIECPCHYAQGDHADPICLGEPDLTRSHTAPSCCELCDSSESTHAVTKKKVAWRRVAVAIQGRFGQLPADQAFSRAAISPNLLCLTTPDLDDLQTRLE
jgi:hypothetical protein